MTKLLINFKSGLQQKVTVESYKHTRYVDGHRKFEWTDMVPKPVSLDIEEVESIWEIK